VTTTITVRGADTLARTARAAARDLADLRAVNAAVARRIAAAANPPRRSGRLAASITPSSTATEAVVSSGLVYAPVQEYGWAAHGIEGRHFLQTAFDTQRAATVGAYDDAVNDAVRQIKGA
jgi:phage gpG-like protein